MVSYRKVGRRAGREVREGEVVGKLTLGRCFRKESKRGGEGREGGIDETELKIGAIIGNCLRGASMGNPSQCQEG